MPIENAAGPEDGTDATVVIVAWQDHDALDECLAGLAQQTVADFEVIVADNGAGLSRRLEPWKTRLDLIHLDMGGNHGPSPARNAAATHARSGWLLFLDDDAVPAGDWVERFLAVRANPRIVAARGRVEPKRAGILNELARAYDLGRHERPAIINTEGNCAIDRSALRAVGGFNESMFGHEGAELSVRLIDAHGEDAIVYTPHAVIYHDYATSIGDYWRKRFRHGVMMRHLDLSDVRMAATKSVRRSRWTWSRLFLLPVKAIGIVAEAVGFARSLIVRSPAQP